MLNLEKIQVLDEMVPSFVQDVSTQISSGALSVFAAVGILVELYSLISGAKDLHSIENSELCTEAKKLHDVICEMENEY